MNTNEVYLPIMVELRKFLPHYTPCKADIIIYANVQEAHSANKDDVHKYLNKLKLDLKVGSHTFPSYVLLCGDQQTYSIIVELKRKNPSMFSWFRPLPGDWHLMKLVSEVIRDLLWDGGLKQFCSQCGIRGELVQWQDIHIMLLSTYEALLDVSVDHFNSIQDVTKVNYWE